MAKNGLTPKQQAFCVHYIAFGRNGTRAVQAAGWRCNANSAAVWASQLLRNPKVSEELARLTLAALKQAQVSADELLRELSWVASSNYADLIWAPGELDSHGQPTTVGRYKPVHELAERVQRCIKSIRFDAQGNRIVELWNKDMAMTNLAKYHKLLTDRIEVSGQISLADRIKAARARVGI